MNDRTDGAKTRRYETSGPNGGYEFADLPGAAEFDPRRPLRSFPSVAGAVLLAPRAFFAGLDPHRSAGSALLFALLCYAVSYVLEGTAGRAIATLLVGPGAATDGGVGGVAGLMLGLAPFLLGLLASAALVHLAARAFLTPELGFGATLRVACYASATELVAWLPIVGPVAIFYWILLMVLGLIFLNAAAAPAEEEENA